jgi:hypothetical protein
VKRLTLRRHHLASEEGVALVLAVIILAIITIAAASAIFYTQGSQSDAFSKKGGQTAYSLAQAAVSNATAELLPHYYNSSGQPFDNTTDLTSMVAYAPTGSQQSPSSTAACTTSPLSSCMQWTSILECPVGVSCSPGAPTISPPAYERGIWHITGTGTVPNPSGTQPLTRTITIDVPLIQPPAKAPAPDIFKIIYAGKVSSGCDLTTQQSVNWAAPVYVAGNMCMTQNSALVQGTTNLAQLNVGGWLEISGNGAHVGTSSQPVSSLAVGGICTTDSTSTQPPPNSAVPPNPSCAATLTKSGGVWTDSNGKIFVYQASAFPSIPSPPMVDFSPALNPGDVSCTGRQLTPVGGTFILNGSPYSCSVSTAGVQTGSISWDGTTLKINGNIYINGNLITTSPKPQMVYQGLGTIYVNGTVSFENNTELCVEQIDPSGGDCPDKESWPNVADNFLMIAAAGDMTGGTSNANVSIEGGVYSKLDINFGSGTTHIYGPIVTPNAINPGQQAAEGFPNIINLFTGLPGSPQPFWVLGPPQDGTY